VKHYTIEWRRREPDLRWTRWTNVIEAHSLFNTAIMDTVQVGPFPQNLHVGGGPATEPGVMAYDNHEGDSDWALSDQAFKVVIDTVGGPYAPTPATVEFRVQGYGDAGHQPPHDGWIQPRGVRRPPKSPADGNPGVIAERASGVRP
jgi:hypothetical protein